MSAVVFQALLLAVASCASAVHYVGSPYGYYGGYSTYASIWVSIFGTHCRNSLSLDSCTMTHAIYQKYGQIIAGRHVGKFAQGLATVFPPLTNNLAVSLLSRVVDTSKRYN